jgi:cytochrome c oxidase assembly protein subunit 15
MRLRWLASIALVLSLFVVMLGAYTRLTDAGLGCPDWPGCYGQMVLPSAKPALHDAQANYPTIPIESRKAWTEMIHRYVAGTLALLIFIMGIAAIRDRKNLPWKLPAILMGLVIFQALLGMWTVTLRLLPIVVMGHLLGGIFIVASLSRYRMQLSGFRDHNNYQWRPWVRIAAILVFLQIALGGWVSANYAGIACIGFPQCNGLWLPPLDLAKGFHLFSSLGANHQGGLLDIDVRMTIQFIHRIGAVITALYILILAVVIQYKSQSQILKKMALGAGGLVILQFILGIINVVYLLPIQIAVAHNGTAALLFALVFTMLHFTQQKDGYAPKN